MKTSTERTKFRFRAAIFLVFILAAFALAKHMFWDLNNDLDGVFVPDDVVKNTKVVLEAIESLETSSLEPLSCSDSIQRVSSDLIVKNSKVTYENAGEKLVTIWAYFSKNGVNPKCSDLAPLLSAAYKLKALLAANPKLDLEREVRLLHTQNLNWDNQVTCIFSNTSSGAQLVMGGPQCKQRGQLSLDQSQVTTLRNFARPLMAIAKNRYRSGTSPIELTLTIDPVYQSLLNEISSCVGERNKCPSTWDATYSQVEYAAFSILDADLNQVLAVGCFGKACEKIIKKELGVLSSATVEVPPASTEKLLFAYALADLYPDTRSRLPYEIKTSGDVGGEVRKRNEWWERSAICDLSKKGESNCRVLKRAREFAHAVGWNHKCSDTANQICGTSEVLSPLGIERFSPVAGRALVTSSKEGYFEDARIGEGGFLSWTSYDRIREGKEKATNYKQLANTSLAVQSVIGAGDNRVTSLGLGMLASGLYQSANFGRIKPVVLFKVGEPSSEAKVNQSAARIVVDGMNKVPVGVEAGWQGAGTAASAFKKIMGKACDSDCPLFGKTGTVGGKDSAYAGTTLFTGYFSTTKLASYVGMQPRNRRTLSIGVLVKPVKANGIHYASNLSMALIKELLDR